MLAPIQKLLSKAAHAVSTANRRGTVLLLVLGSLALVLILAVVYAALGKGDRRTASETVVRKEAVATIDGIAAHILDVFGTDVTNLVPEVTDSNALGILGLNRSIMRREAVDMPVTDFFFTSVPTEIIGGNNPDVNLINALRFHPDGGHNPDIIWDEPVSLGDSRDLKNLLNIDIDPRVANDPFLAATRPVDLGASGLGLDLPPYMRHLDWSQISNFAPDGRFVNLFYLRDNFGAPSIDLTRDPNSTGRSRLWLFDDNGDPTQNLPFEMMAGAPTDTEEANWNIPAHWTMFQRRLFRPINDPDFVGTDMGNPGDENYWAYQYADADGDGFLDSRWIELVDSSNPNLPRPVLADSDMRFFVAARAIDLSSLVNVATATDFLAPSTTAHRMGAGPQEINLFKLLNSSEHPLTHASPDQIRADQGVNYDAAFETGTGQAGDYGRYNKEVAHAVGRKAYLRLHNGGREGIVQPFGIVPGEENPGVALSTDIRDYTTNLRPEDRDTYQNVVGSVYPGITGGGNARTAPYSIDDLVELLTFHGINDDRNFSKLEQAMSSVNDTSIPFASYSPLRSDSATQNDAWAPGSFALADARETKLMRSAVDIRRMLTTVSGSRPLRSSLLNAANFSKLDEKIDRKFLLDTLVVGSVNYKNTADGDTLADLRNEQSRLISNAFGVYLEVLAPDLTQQSWEGTLDTATGNLLPNETQTQFYGHMGPELAVRLAGHMALNFRDMADGPFLDVDRNGMPDVPNLLGLDLSDSTQQTLYSLRQDDPSVAVLRLSENLDLTADTGILGQLWNDGVVPADGTGPVGMKLDVNKLLNPRGTPVSDLVSFLAADRQYVSHEAMILYGTEPQPFLSQVSSMTMYTDVSNGINGFDDWLQNDPANGEWDRSPLNGGAGPDGALGSADDWDGLPNIKGEVDAANKDFLFQAMFFQIFNPFDVPVVLNNYYIEFADSFYSVADPTSAPVVLQPRSTVVLWTSNPINPVELDQRLVDGQIISSTITTSTSVIQEMVSAQIGADVPNRRLNRRFKFDGTNYTEVTGFDDLFHGTITQNSVANRAVMLWRDAPNYADPATGRIDWTAGTVMSMDRSTDQMIDRLRDTSDFKIRSGIVASGIARGALDRRVKLQPQTSPDGNSTINDALIGDAANRAAPNIIMDSPPAWTNYNYDDKQIGIALWGNISRLDDGAYTSTGSSAVDYYTTNVPGGGANGARNVDGTPVGALPAKVFEPVSTDPANPYTQTPLIPNDLRVKVAGDGDVLYPEELNLITDLNNEPFPRIARKDAALFWAELRSGTITGEVFTGLGTPVLLRNTTVELSSPIPDSTVTDFGTYTQDRYIKVTMNQTEFADLLSGRRTLRVGDMLLPLAVGAYRTPLEPGTNPLALETPDGVYSTDVLARLDQYEAQWTTLGEALAAAAGYSAAVGPGGGVATNGPKDPFRSLSFDFASGVPTPKGKTVNATSPPAILPYVLDRGQLRLDAFVPFIDMGTNSITDMMPNGEYKEGVDIRRGLGIPLALSLFDIAQAGAENGQLAMGDIDRPVMGTINVNTADPETLRLHPALGMDVFSGGIASPANGLWWPRSLEASALNAQNYFLNTFRNTRGSVNDVADVGSTIAAYRDPARYQQLIVDGRSAPGNPPEVNYFTRIPADASNPERGMVLDRETASEIDAIRTNPGILSMGELFAARDMRRTDVEHQMGGFAHDDRTLGVGFIDRFGNLDTNPNFGKGVLNPTTPLERTNREIATFGNHLTGDLLGYAMNYGTGATTPPEFPGTPGGPMLPIMPDQIPDSYDEQLVQLNAVMNAMSVRSDYFAVWFIVHGYKESDTEDLQPSDPLSPSFAARYLMIVDRSNVTEKGQQPKVLAFVQLPMLPAPPAPGTF